MFQGDTVLNYPCEGLSDTSSACAAALNMGDSYTPPGFSTQVNNLTLVAKPTASRLSNGSNILQFEMIWRPEYGSVLSASYVSGPLMRYGTGYNALSEHELEDTPFVKITKSGDMKCFKHCDGFK
ncbi:hypothetical protein Ndes2526B_g00605 [Nannochloris sp. 'desiccata']